MDLSSSRSTLAEMVFWGVVHEHSYKFLACCTLDADSASPSHLSNIIQHNKSKLTQKNDSALKTKCSK